MKERIKTILEAINEGAFEREEAISLSLLSALAGESIFMLGLPGVGKSMIARKLKMAFKDASVFEYLMSRFSTPDEIFGPVSIMGLKDNDRYERVTKGYLPEAEVVFLDEIWKAGPAIQNSLLTVLNEKIFLNGNKEMQLPVKAIISASNELPAEGEGLEALWDRFLIRYVVEPIKSQDNFFRLIGGKDNKKGKKSREFQAITNAEYENIRKETESIGLPDKVLNLLYSLREKLNHQQGEDEEEEVNKKYISDRRWKKAVGVMKTSAYLNERKEVDLSDAVLLSHMLWNEDSLMEEINKVIADCIVVAIHEKVMQDYRSKVKIDPSKGKKPFSRDGKNYIIQCDDYPLKISRADYDKIKAKPGEYFFGSETKDGTLKIYPQTGQYTIRFIREGVININSYNYPLKSLEDVSESIVDGDELELVADRLMREFEQSVKENIFIDNPPILKAIHVAGKIYREKLSHL